ASCCPKTVIDLRTARAGLTGAARFGGAIVAHAVALRKSGPERRDADNAVTLVEAHRDDAACLGMLPIDGLDVRADDLSSGADEQQLLVLLGHLLDGGDVARLLALEADQADPLRAAMHR